MLSVRRRSLALLTALSTSALAEPISLLCTADFEENGERKIETHHLVIDIEEKEMVYGGPKREKWTALEDIEIDKVSVTGTMFLGSKDIYIIMEVDRTNLDLDQKLFILGDPVDSPTAKCEIADFEIETVF